MASRPWRGVGPAAREVSAADAVVLLPGADERGGGQAARLAARDRLRPIGPGAGTTTKAADAAGRDVRGRHDRRRRRGPAGGPDGGDVAGVGGGECKGK